MRDSPISIKEMAILNTPRKYQIITAKGTFETDSYRRHDGSSIVFTTKDGDRIIVDRSRAIIKEIQ